MADQEERVRILLDSYAELRRLPSSCGYLGKQIAAAYKRKLKLDVQI